VILEKARQEEIGVILVNRSLMKELGDFPSEFRSEYNMPVLTEVPDTSGLPSGGSVARYVRDEVGIRE
jgi:vacuolar-type H+-ATPase subunit F/Vma7